MVRVVSVLLLWALVSPAIAQRLDPAKWTFTLEPAAAAPGSTILGQLDVKLEGGWHLYSPTTPPGGPIPTTIELAESDSVASFEVLQKEPVTKFDPAFQIDTETYDKETTFLFLIRVTERTEGTAELTAKVRYQLCNDTQCLPPKRKTAVATLSVEPGAGVVQASVPAGYAPAVRPAAKPSSAAGQAPGTPAEPVPASDRGGAADEGMLQFLLVAFGFGLAAIFTPCVFPMVPITVSFFLNQQTGGRRDGLAQAVVFCVGIIALFTSLGLATTALLGPFGVVQLGSNPWVNGFISIVFLVFGLSLLGAFEITLPSGLLTRMNQASQRGGYAGTLIMGLTFSLTAFACVGPFVGTLLAASIQGESWKPVFGMIAFAGGLALPFFFLALFPSYLQRMPRAGGWMARVKVVLGFIILAAMFKYLSNVDQVLQLGFLTRERVLALWIVLFALPGLYLLGFLRLEGIEEKDRLGVSRLLIGTAFLVFSVSLVPGMFGGRLGELDAYIPAAKPGSAFSPGGGSGRQLTWKKNQYREALEEARAQGKLVFVNFTGYACTNCHWMKANMFTRPEIAAALERFVLVDLYTDGADPESEANQAFQEEKFATIAIPFYAILDPDEKVLATFPGLTREPADFLAFLNDPFDSAS